MVTFAVGMPSMMAIMRGGLIAGSRLSGSSARGFS